MAIVDQASADAAYIASLSYESDKSGATAQNFLAACRYYYRFDVQNYSIAGRSLTRRELKDQIESAEGFFRASPANGARVNMFTRGRVPGLGI